MSIFLRSGRTSLCTKDSQDSFDDVKAPSPQESRAERETRLRYTAECQRRSDAIDEEINRRREMDKRSSKCVRLLLLGQSESGKSTTLKNFQLMHSAKHFRLERASWKAVVQVNLIRSVRIILDTIDDIASHASCPGSTSSLDDDDGLPAVGANVLQLKARLLPLKQVEERLLRKMTPLDSPDLEPVHMIDPPLPQPHCRARRIREIVVRSNSSWKTAFVKLVGNARSSTDSCDSAVFVNDPNDPSALLHSCANDIIRLWEDPSVRAILTAQRIRLEEMSGFFLDSIERVTSLGYLPTDDDILRARMKTLGVSEHRFKLFPGSSSHEWRVYDVGGARTLRAAWAPYFDNMDAILYLAPLSGFDETLVEDPSVNKLEDSIGIWKMILKNPLLRSTQIVLFLNKYDLLQAKIDAGVRFGHFVIAYGDRPNDAEAIAAYIRKKFELAHKQHSTPGRLFYCHLTALIDAKATQAILVTVKDMVIRQSLRNTNLL